MTISKTHDGEKTIFSLAGRLDMTAAQDLQKQLIPEINTAKEVTLDFAGLSFVTSAGLRVLLAAERSAEEKGVKMLLTNVSPEIMELFGMTGFDEILTIR